jgi:acetylornithine deacetylase
MAYLWKSLSKGFTKFATYHLLEQKMKEPIELLKSLIRIPSNSREEKDAADLLQEEMTARGLLIKRQGNNLWALSHTFLPNRPTLLLNAHIDTVRPASGWMRNPYEPTIEGTRLYGLGSNDCGGGLVSLLEVFCLLEKRQQSYNLIFLASAEEEVSGKNGISSVLNLLPPIDIAIVGEPTSLQPAIAERGLMVLDCTAQGKAGHAARNEGINAIYRAIDDIQWIRSYQFPKESDLLGPVKMTTTIIHAGTLHNCIPDSCTFTVDIRVNECYTNQEILDFIIDHLQSDVKARSTRLSSSSIPLSHPLIQKIISLGLKPFGSPTLSDQALMPFPSLKLGPGDSARSHTADEYIDIEDISCAIQLYMTLLDGATL